MLYSLRNLRKIYSGRTVLDLPELFIEKGKIYGLLGPNGSGKTTLLSILSFLDAPSAGTVFFNDRPVSFSGKALQALRRQVVLVDQHPILFSTSVYKNVEFGLKVRKLSTGKRRRIIEESLDRVGMRGFAEADGRGLSGGETQRVAIARALACSPDVILFDEPTASVDISNQIAIENIIRDLHDDAGITVILSTHNLFQAAKLAQEKIYLFEGRTSQAAYENIFSGEAFSEGQNHFCRISEKVTIPIRPGHRERIKVALNPGSVKLLPDTEKGEGAGIFEGRVIQLTQEKKGVRVLTDIGIPLSILLKNREYSLSDLRVGNPVRIQVFDYGVEVI
ncbi:ABC transporter [Desulfonema ishimotonii]|uniref:ABC transporter n=1 Tax=Desulfonema ishimotonii TaxID=45657 RepID=A0A401FQ68_9BACT|nr:ATP-binding cassette domain-containing protein [Desulfonema ishimotonii]GBC59100.1 ABC transporter [Desulfonema ishimotonii]